MNHHEQPGLRAYPGTGGLSVPFEPIPFLYHNHYDYKHRTSIRALSGNAWVPLCPDCWHHQCLIMATSQCRGASWPERNRALDDGALLLPYRDRAIAAPRRVMLYSHDTYGLGHLRRNLAIASQLLALPGKFEVMLLTGSPMQDSWPLPQGLTVRALPPVVKVGNEQYGPRDHTKNFALLKGHREALILEATLSFRPDVFLVDHAPIGMGGELLPTLALLQENYPQTRRILGMRDIIDAPDATRRVWGEQGILDILDRVYDEILVYGRQDWFDVVEAYDIPSQVAHKIHYCGYVCNEIDLESQTTTLLPPSVYGLPRVLVTVGGGGDGCRIIEAYLDALRQADSFGCQSLIVPGPLMDPIERERLEILAAGLPDVHLIEGATDMLPLMRQCELIIAMAGYNTSAEILSLKRKAILVPRARPRAEQRLRAKMFTRFDLTDCIDPDADIAEQLIRLVPIALQPTHTHRFANFPLDGAARVASVLDAHMVRRKAALET